MRKLRDSLKDAVIATTFFAMGCGPSSNPTLAANMSGPCLQQIANAALSNPSQNFMAANFAGPLGLVDNSEPDAAPYLSHQVETHSADGSSHFFAIDSSEWNKALLIHLVPTRTTPSSFFFTIDRNGNLITAGRMINREFSLLNIRDRSVISHYSDELNIWRLADPSGACA